MKKIIITILIIFATFISYSQPNLNNDSTLVSNQEIVDWSNHIKDLEEKIKMKDEIIDEFKNQIFYWQRLQYSDSVIIYIQNEQIALRNTQITAYKTLYKSTKPKWYSGRMAGFVFGVGTVMGSSWILNNIK